MSTRLGARASHYMAIDWVADSAALATAAFTGLLAVVAYVQLGGQRKDLQQVGNKLDALRAEALEADLAPKRRQEYRDRRSLAEQVRLRRVNSEELLVAPSTTPISYGYLEVINGSDQPIRTVDVWFADEYAYDAGQLDPDAPEPRQILNRQRPTLAEIRPGDTWYFLVLPTSRYDAQDADVCAWFTDANGARWRKNMIGQLDEIAPTPSLPSGQDQSPSG